MGEQQTAEVVFARETIGRVLAGTPIVVCSDPAWETAINTYNHELALMVSAQQLGAKTIEAYGYVARSIARAGATLGVPPNRLGDQDVRNLVHEACRLPDRRSGTANETKIRAYLSGLLRFHAAQNGPKSPYFELLIYPRRG